MTTTCKPSTRGCPMLLSLVTVIIGIQLGTTALSAEGVNVQLHEDPPTPIVSRFKSFNEERAPPPLEDISHTALSTKSSGWERFKTTLLGNKGAVSPLGWKADLLDQMESTTDPTVFANSIRNLFDADGVGSVTGPVFVSEEFRRWSKSIKLMYPNHQFWPRMGMFGHLYNYYGEKLPDMLTLAKCDSRSHEWAEVFETLMLDDWILSFRSHLGYMISFPFVQNWYKELKENHRSPAAALRFRLEASPIPDWRSQLRRADAEGRDAEHIWKDIEAVEPYQIQFRIHHLHLTADIQSLLISRSFKTWKSQLGGVTIGQALLSTVRDRFTSDKELLAAFHNLPGELQMYNTEVRGALMVNLIDLNYDPEAIANIFNQVVLNPLKKWRSRPRA